MEMILRVDNGQLLHMGLHDPKEIWQTLQQVHHAAGFATSLALRRRFLTVKKDVMQSMQAWIGDIQSLGIWMVEVGIEVTDQDKILTLSSSILIQCLLNCLPLIMSLHTYSMKRHGRLPVAGQSQSSQNQLLSRVSTIKMLISTQSIIHRLR